MRKVNILMVCLGNICRSPLAEGILKSKVDSDKIFVDSAGTIDYHQGNKPDSRSIDIAAENDINLNNKRSRIFTINDFDKFDVIYAMDNSNYKDIIKLARNNGDKEKVKLILNEIYPNENKNVPDPYYGGENGFKNVFEMLDKACDKIASKYS